MKASFFGRVGAYIIDIIIIGIIASLISVSLPKTESETEKKLDELANQFISGDVDTDTYLEEYQDLIYTSQKESMLENGISIAITIAYFVIFQYMNKGQTLGKKLLRIKVVDKETNENIGIARGLLRSLIFLGIATSSLSLILINLLSKKAYMYSYMAIGSIETLFLILTIIFTLYRQDGRGLHDMMAGSTVIKEGEQ